jgi:hypothetical protein
MADHRGAAYRADDFQRVGGAALIAAGVLILTSFGFPRPDDPADHAGFLALLVENAGLTKAIILAVPLGIWALVIGVTAIQSSIAGRAGDAFARIGLYGVLGGTAVITVQFALAAGALIEGATADAGVVLWAAATYVRSFGMMVLWLALASVGVGMVTSAVYPAWSGWVPIGLGVAMAGVSLVAIVAGATLMTAIISGGLAALTALWAVSLGIWIARRATRERSALPAATAPR